ncbi:MAG: phosphoribosylformylglycinamidine synthase [Eubacteriales bacterium]
MSVTKRIYVEKKDNFAVEAHNLSHDLKEHLHLESLNNIRVINRYDAQGLDDTQFSLAVSKVFSEPAVDNTFEEIDFDKSKAFAVEYLPGQFDQRADSAVQCIQLIADGVLPQIRCAKVYVVDGDLSPDEIGRIKEYIINPVDSHEVTLEKYDTLDIELEVPDDIEILSGFCKMTDSECEQFKMDLGLAMSIDDVKFVREYFQSIERDPYITEIRVIDTYWSDHCRHTTFSTIIEDIEIEDSVFLQNAKESLKKYRAARQEVYAERIESKKECLMDVATMGVKLLSTKGLLHDLDVSEEINACSIKIDVDIDGKKEPWLLMFKNETHNHPTEIEPFGGAATCLGGAIRDPLSGRSYVYQAMRVTGSADPRGDVSDHLPGKLPQRLITTGAAHGYSSYGNQIGLATGQVVEIYDDSYVAKRMEIGAVIAAAPSENVVRERPEAGDVVVLLGGATGRDGCGGATGSSKAHDIESIDTCGAEVQKGNAPTERKLQRLFRNPAASKIIKRCNDFGAGGVCVAIGELAESLMIDLDKVPKKYDGLDGTELAISESQERMAVVLDKENVDKFIDLAKEENLEAVVVADITSNGKLIMTWRGKECLNIDRSFLDTNGAPQYTKIKIAAPDENLSPFIEQNVDNIKEKWMDSISSLNTCIQRGLSERFDSTIGAGTVTMPFGGKYQLTPTQSMVAKIPVLEGDTNTVSIMTYGFSPEIYRFSPYHGAVYAVLESLLKVSATGGDMAKARLTFQEYFERLRNEPKRWGKPLAALLGAFDVQEALKIPAIGGKDSMSGSFVDIDVVPTLVSFAVATGKAESTITPEFKETDSTIALLEMPIDSQNLPDYEKFKNICSFLSKNIEEKKIISAHTISAGGIATAITKMAVGNQIGADIDMDSKELFQNKYLSVLVEMPNAVDAAELIKDVDGKIIGRTTDENFIQAGDVKILLSTATNAITSVLEDVFPVNADKAYKVAVNESYISKSNAKAKISAAKPKVLIPVFPGTNCEYDSKRAFDNAGAEAEIFIFKNYSPSVIQESIEQMAKLIDNSQIVMLPGGFSLGDEPEGSGKYIANVLSNGQIAESIMNLLKKRDGLMLGICNGFQALIKVGLVPYGDIRPMRDDSPTLTFNDIGRHQSRIVHTRVASSLSPWMSQVQVGDVISVAISHGEGKFVCSKEEMQAMSKNGQIATQYVNLRGDATYDINFNPNGSYNAVEGITSPDGRVLGKMGHNERYTKNTFINVPGNFDSKIFKSGVEYFK